MLTKYLFNFYISNIIIFIIHVLSFHIIVTKVRLHWHFHKFC